MRHRVLVICLFQLRHCTILNKPFMNRQDACSTRKLILCGTGILPVADNGAISQFQSTHSQLPITNSQFSIPKDCYNLVNSAKGSKWLW